MLSFYKRTLLSLFTKLQQVRKDPLANADLCLEIQESLIKKITYIERRIRQHKNRIKTSKKTLATKRPIPLTKAEAARIKDVIKDSQYLIDRYQHLLIIFKCISDALAFTFINKWDIKPMTFKESPGALSGKEGGRLERGILRAMFRGGYIAILNDITNCLRYGDITVFKDNRFVLIEAKSGKHDTARTKRQIEGLEKIQTFLLTDKVTGLHPTLSEVRRSELKLKEKNHRRKLNKLIDKALVQGKAWAQIENGLFYYVDYDAGKFDVKAIETIAKKCIAKPIVFYDMFRSGGLGYYPYTLTIERPDALFAFYSGELSIFVVIDPAAIENKLAAKGLAVSFEDDEQWALNITYLDPEKDVDGRYLKTSHYMFQRVPHEFLGLDWFLEDFSRRFFTLHEMFEDNAA